jgi:hypothetical protein
MLINRRPDTLEKLNILGGVAQDTTALRCWLNMRRALNVRSPRMSGGSD